MQSVGSFGSHPLRAAILGALVLSMSLALVHTAQAAITGGPDIISAPASVVNSSAAGGASNDHQQGFDEQQGVVLTAPLAVDGGTIPAGTAVDSHMIFLNSPDSISAASDLDRVWTFSGPILGVIADQNGALLAASDFLGAPGTTYPGAFPSRGLEANDGYVVAGTDITVSMTVTQPGDWIRVVTAARPQTAHGCKDDGWQAFVNADGSRMFKNQGDCVSFVVTDGRNPPDGP